MANNLEDADQRRPPIFLLGFLLLLGTLFAWWGTRDYRRMFGESLREPVAAAGTVLPQLTQEESALLDRASQISQRQCAGCHERAVRSSAPSYREIVGFYRQRFPGSLGNPDLRSRLASAVTHPRPGWGNFAPGPSESQLSLGDRTALASWILNSFDREKKADEAAGQ
ncbi:MAG: c-type cytochrome [Candidatus Sulfotelmatobacter sp.]|jgi:cytochrome c551/c552